jgi:3'-phosphoadenosine 5'-phosphosulfate sulfotransferase (PAPS reductase)/FAD synthetase
MDYGEFMYDLFPREIPKTPLWVSVSGGRTSMMMARLIQQEGIKAVYVFANTGQEHPKTLDFINQCDRNWGLGIVWLEAVQHNGERKGATHRVVTFDIACRDGRLFREMTEKYGIANKSYPHCNRELKLNPMKSYIATAGLSNLGVAIGIRADEPRRLPDIGLRGNRVYPLADWWPATKQDVLDWWEDQPFDLEIEEREGNCVWCWKKSEKKHFANIANNPEWYGVPRDLEREFTSAKSKRGNQVFFRGALSTDQLFKQYDAVGFDSRYLPKTEESGACSESCEAFQ